jgi:LmbE family N-acetylglucosaminyl deacetylase
MTALFLEPHDDDLVLFSCFNLIHHQDDAMVITCLRSDVQNSPAYPGGPITWETRERETMCALGELGIGWYGHWEYLDSDPDWREIAIAISECQLQFNPSIVFAPAIEESGHEQHNEIGRIALGVFGLRVQPYLTYTRLGGRSKGAEVEYEPEWVALKYRALACYESQICCPATRAHFIDDCIREYVP